MVYLMVADEYAEHNFDDMDDRRLVWNVDDQHPRAEGSVELCHKCGYEIPENEMRYVSNENEVRCGDCVEVISIDDMLRCWRDHSGERTFLVINSSDVTTDRVESNIHSAFVGCAYTEDALREWANDRWGTSLHASLKEIAADIAGGGWLLYENI